MSLMMFLKFVHTAVKINNNGEYAASIAIKDVYYIYEIFPYNTFRQKRVTVR
jgi:hypothetical protein